MSRSEITFREFLRYADATGLRIVPASSRAAHDHPAVRAPLRHAQAYARWLSSESGQKYRLPTEAEWEFAARAGKSAARHWDETPDRACRYANVLDRRARTAIGNAEDFHRCDDGNVRVATPGSYRANAFGLYDMLGNVWEWTCSDYSRDYDSAESQCAGTVEPNGPRVVRGGSWTDEPRWVRSAVRLRVLATDNDVIIGFRVVCEFQTGEALPNLQDIDPADEFSRPDPSAPAQRAALGISQSVVDAAPIGFLVNDAPQMSSREMAGSGGGPDQSPPEPRRAGCLELTGMP